MMIINKPPGSGQTQGTPFLFRKRIEKIDWRRLAAVDVNRVASQMDIDTLQEILTSVAFCDITSEIDTRSVDTNFIKLFQLAQLLVEYLLYSQEYLTNSMNTLKEENEELKKDMSQLQDQLVQKSNRLTVVRRECHRRRLLLLAQQQLMDSGPQSYHRCQYCPKAFLNASFLAAHVHRRHPETERLMQTEQENAAQRLQQQLIPPQSQPIAMEVVQAQNSNTMNALERDVRELLEQLRSSTNQQSPRKQVMFMKPQTDLVVMEPSEKVKTDDEASAKPDWQTVMMEEHRRDMELLRNMFEKELRALQAQHATTQEELAQLKIKRAASNLGDLVDDVAPISKETTVLPVSIKEMSPVKESVMQRERVVNVGASVRSSLPEPHISPSRKSIPVYDEPTLSGSKASMRSEIRTISEHVSRHSAPSPAMANTPTRSEGRTDNSKRRSSQSPLQASVSQVAETEDTGDESDNQQVSHAMGRMLTVSGASSPAQSVNLSTNVLRYSRLLDQLRADPETLRGLRHEVEQLLVEQLSERGVEANQTRLTTTELNDRLIVLRRERENLAKKHVNFFEIRETLAQHVDRLANAMLHGKSVPRTSSSDLRSGSARLQRASVITKSGLPPPAMHSPNVTRKGGTLPIPAMRRADITSGLGSSMPTLGQHETPIRSGKLHTSPTANMIASSPHLQFEEVQLDEPHSSRSVLSNRSPQHRAVPETSSLGSGQFSTHTATPPPRKARGSPQRSRTTASPYKLADRSPVLKSPSIQLSHDQRVLTFNRPEGKNPAVAASSTDEWDSEPDEPLLVGSGTGARTTTSAAQLIPQRSMGEAPDVLGSGVDLDEADRFLNELGDLQRNSNALFNQESPVVAPIHMELTRAHSVRTDDEDICSVSSINGGMAEDTSVSMLPGTPTKHGTKLYNPRVSRSLDPNVAAAQAQAAALGPRPGTRFGPSVHHSISMAGTGPISTVSPDITNTLGTSFWGTNSKAVSLSTNINSALKSENVDDDDLDTDE